MAFELDMLAQRIDTAVDEAIRRAARNAGLAEPSSRLAVGLRAAFPDVGAVTLGEVLVKLSLLARQMDQLNLERPVGGESYDVSTWR